MLCCYACQTEITQENESEEHVIPNSIGGRIKSKKLICKKCNNDFGTKHEGKFSEQLRFLSSRLPVKRDRKKDKDIKLNALAIVDGVKREVVLDKRGKASFKSPKIDKVIHSDGGVSYNCIFNNKEEIAKFNLGLKRKYKDRKIDFKFNQNEIISNNILYEFKVTFNDISFLKTIQKIILNLYIYKGGEIRHIINEAKDVFTTDKFPPVQYSSVKKTENKKFEFSHKIAVFGRPHDKILFGCVELFGAIHLIGILNDNYLGPPLYFTHAINPISGENIEFDVDVKFTREELILIVKENPIDYDEIIEQLKAAEEAIMNRHYFENIIDKAFKNVLERKDKKIISLEDVSYISNEIAYLLTPNILAASEKRRKEAEIIMREKNT